MRRILNAIKMFDESLRINFTQPLYKVTSRVLKIVRESFISLQESSTVSLNFDTSIMGVESCAFFITLGIVK